MRRWTAFLLALGLLAAGFASTSSHDHGIETTAADVCFSEHGEEESLQGSSGERVARAGLPHEHHCAICHVGRDRATSENRDVEATTLAAAESVPRGARRAQLEVLDASNPDRGPPTTKI